MKALALVLGVSLLGCAGPTAQEPSEEDDDVSAAGGGGSGGGGSAGRGGSAGSPADAGAPRPSSPDAAAAGGPGGSGGSAGAGSAGAGGRGGTGGSATGGTGGTMARDAGAPEAAAPRPSDAAPLTGPAEMTADMDGVMTAYTIKKAQVYTFGGAANLTVEGTNTAGTLIVAAKGMSAGTFPCGGDFYLSYTTARGTWSTVAPGGTCTITITAFGAVGEPIRGTFSGTLPPFFGVTGTKKVANGSFSAIRAKNNEG